MVFVIVLLKIFALPLLFIFAIGLINLPFAAIARLFSATSKTSLIYSILVSIIYAYLYALWGAYLRAVVLTYASTSTTKWVLIALCILSITTSIKYTNQEKEVQRAKMNEMSFGFVNAEALSQAILVICLSLSPFIFASFVTFFFTEGLYETAFFKPALIAARLFL